MNLFFSKVKKVVEALKIREGIKKDFQIIIIALVAFTLFLTFMGLNGCWDSYPFKGKHSKIHIRLNSVEHGGRK